MLRRIIRTRRTYRHPPLFGSLGGYRTHGNERAVRAGMEFHDTFDLGEQSMIGTHADIMTGVPRRAALTRNDVAGNHEFAAKRLDAKAFALRIAPVARGSACFFVSHGPSPIWMISRSIP